MLRRIGDGAHGKQQPGPYLADVDTRAQEVIRCFVELIAQGTRRIHLEAMSFPAFSRPCKASQKKSFTFGGTAAR